MRTNMERGNTGWGKKEKQKEENNGWKEGKREGKEKRNKGKKMENGKVKGREKSKEGINTVLSKLLIVIYTSKMT